jgi:antitoxin component of RelBE/YafQ-DinJ toxin-antitoxin module
MSAIYNTIDKMKSLKKELTPEIRGVFDRMLTSPTDSAKMGGDTIIAPDHAPGELMAKVHDADDKSTEPKDADSVGDRVASEVDQTVTKHIGEIKDVVSHATEAKRQSEAAADVSAVGGSAESSATNEVIAGQPGEVSGVGSVAEGEGVAVRTGETSGTESGTAQRGTAGVDEGSGPTAGPSWDAQWDAAVEKLKDKYKDNQGAINDEATKELLGNIRLENLTESGRLKDFMRFIADKTGAKFDTPISSEMTAAFAESMGMDARELNMGFLREITAKDGIPLHVRVRVGRETLVQSVKECMDLKNKLDISKSDADTVEFTKALARNGVFFETISGITGEAGRTLAAFKNLKGGEAFKNAKAFNDLFQEAAGKTPEQIRQMSAQLELFDKDDPKTQQVRAARQIRTMRDPKFFDKLLAYRDINLCSGPVTHTYYAVAGLLNNVKAALLRGLSGDVEHMNQMFSAMPVGFSDGWGMAKTILKEGRSSEKLDDLYRQSHNAKVDFSKSKIAPIRTLDYVPRIISSIHAVLKGINSASSLAYEGCEQALREGYDPGTENFNNRVAQFKLSPPDGVVEKIEKEARQSVFEIDGQNTMFDKLGKNVVNMVSDNPLGRLMFALARVSYRVKVAAINSTPLQLLSSDVRDNLSGVVKHDYAGDISSQAKSAAQAVGLVPGTDEFNKRVEAISKDPPQSMKDVADQNRETATRDAKQTQKLQAASLALATTLAGVTFLCKDNVTGNGPVDPDQRREWLLHNHPNSIQFKNLLGMGEVSFSLKLLGTSGMGMGIMAEFRDGAMHLAEHDKYGETIEKGVAGLLEHISNGLKSETVLDNFASIGDLLSSNPSYSAEKILGDMASSFVPFSSALSQVNKQIDPTLRDTHSEGLKNFFGALDRAMAEIPGLAATLPPRYDIFGQEISRDSAVGNILHPETAYRYENDPVVQKMDSLGIGLRMPSQTISGVKLTNEEYETYSKLAGRDTKNALDQLIKYDSFNNLPRYQQIKQINSMVAKSRHDAAKIVLAQSDSLGQRVIDRKVQISTGGQRH